MSLTVHRALVALGLAALAAAVVLSSAPAQAPPARTLTLEELDKGSVYTHIRNTKTTSSQANSQGDLLVFTVPLADAAGSKQGTLHAACTTTKGARNIAKSTLTCTGVVALRDGQLTIQANLTPSPGAVTTGAVTGGTGAYANAYGVFVSTANKTGAHDVFTLAE